MTRISIPHSELYKASTQEVKRQARGEVGLTLFYGFSPFLISLFAYVFGASQSQTLELGGTSSFVIGSLFSGQLLLLATSILAPALYRAWHSEESYSVPSWFNISALIVFAFVGIMMGYNPNMRIQPNWVIVLSSFSFIALTSWSLFYIAVISRVDPKEVRSRKKRKTADAIVDGLTIDDNAEG